MRGLRSLLAGIVLATVSGLTVGLVPADAAGDPPTNTSAPGFTGVVAVGETLTADPGTWDPADGLTYAYTWLVDGQQAGEGEQYTPAARATRGTPLSLEVVASRRRPAGRPGDVGAGDGPGWRRRRNLEAAGGLGR